tara:strand:+ start:11972 stop:13018 length:1047 start_codon:yes stop_codon:yes gene_type:complete
MNYLKNAWYCAGWSSDIGREPISKTFLEESIVMYRREDGTPVALSNRCPHRFAPLCEGKLKGDNIECPYHGLQYDANGTCILNPHGRGIIPKAAQLRSYPLVEREGTLWIWMGDAENIDEEQIVGTPFLVQKDQYASTTGYLKVKVNYQLFVDNLLDLTHAPYLHPDTLAGATEESMAPGKMTVEFVQGERDIQSNYFVRDMPATPQLAVFWENSAPGDFRALMHWHAPATLVLEVSLTETGKPKEEGVIVPVMHFMTPETATTSHYFFAIGHNRDIGDTEKTRVITEYAIRAFADEDEPMVEACQELMGGVLDLFALQPVLLETDVAAVRARRLLDEMILAEVNTPA